MSLPTWRLPSPYCSTLDVLDHTHPLKVINSLTRQKTRFIPRNPDEIIWYQCGPTVYADSHMGHARTYISLDVLRRIMKEYLGYNVILCQNITDVDDKIIIRSSELGISFRDLAAKYEAEFFEDMASLGVELPDMITRVSEYIPEIIDFVKGLEARGYAYASNGSVYFDTASYQKSGHKYGKLMPEQLGNSALLSEGEGSLAGNDEKRSINDFVLWKRSRMNEKHESNINEPSWDSPWGMGRPGWHIECSAMAKYALNRDSLDIHAGGIDLKFPHHENEIAQSEGFCDCDQWTNYWLHTGHLHIRGLKMSKSLKNFITIREALNIYSSRQIRFCFLLHKYNAAMDYSDDTMNHACNIDKIFTEFFHNVKAILRRYGLNQNQHVNEINRTIYDQLETTKVSVREALLDDFDTPLAIQRLIELIRATNKNIDHHSTALLRSVAMYITSILKIFGLIPASLELGFPLENTSTETTLTPFLDVIAKFREEIRIAAMGNDSKAILQLADNLRDEIMPELGVRLEDINTGGDNKVQCVWKLDDIVTLRKEKEIRNEIKKAKEVAKQEKAKKQQELLEKAKISPLEMFRQSTEFYSAFDENGIPTHDKAGEAVSKNVAKKLQKEWAKQKELYEKHRDGSGNAATGGAETVTAVTEAVSEVNITE